MPLTMQLDLAKSESLRAEISGSVVRRFGMLKMV